MIFFWSFKMKLLGCEVVNGTHGPQVIFSWSFKVCFVLLGNSVQLPIRGPVTSICWMRSMRGNWFTNCLKQLACQRIPQTSQENASGCLQKPSQRSMNQLSFESPNFRSLVTKFFKTFPHHNFPISLLQHSFAIVSAYSTPSCKLLPNGTARNITV